MRTARSSTICATEATRCQHLGEGEEWSGGYGPTPPPFLGRGQNDRRLWKHYLPPTSLADGNKKRTSHFSIIGAEETRLLVSTYVVCERLSVMHQPARLPENVDQISAKHPCSGILHRTPPPPSQKSKIVPRVLVQPYPEHPHPKWKTLTFFPEFRSELTQNTELPQIQTPHPQKWKTLTFFPEFRSELTQNTPPPPPENEKL